MQAKWVEPWAAPWAGRKMQQKPTRWLNLLQKGIVLHLRVSTILLAVLEIYYIPLKRDYSSHWSLVLLERISLVVSKAIVLSNQNNKHLRGENVI